MDETDVCQSCGMRLMNEEDRGTERGGDLSKDYCVHCYADGKFTNNRTMEEMIEINLKYLGEWIKETGQDMTIEEARAQLNEYLPTLKRWQ